MKRIRKSSLLIMALFIVCICGFTVLAGLNPANADFTIETKLNDTYVLSDQPVRKFGGQTRAGVDIKSTNTHVGSSYANVWNPDISGYIGASAHFFNNSFTGIFYITYQSDWVMFTPQNLYLAMRANSGQINIMSGLWTANGD